MNQKTGKRSEWQRNLWQSALVKRFVLAPLLCLSILVSAVLIGGAIYFNVKALGFDLKKLKEVPQRTLVYDRKDKLLGHVSGHGENRVIVPLKSVSKNFIKALLSREDSRFYHHGGVDYRGVARAMWRNMKEGDMEQGASTLTMQLVRNTYGMREKSIYRKLLEVALAKRLERRFSKDKILEFYVNRVYFGAGLYGVEKASQGFFMKPASDLNLGESALLAGIIRGPSLLNPFRNLKAAEATRDEVLARMTDEGEISDAEAEAAKSTPLVLRPPNQRLATGSYVLQTIHDLLDNYLDKSDIEKGGLRIYTTIDSDLQSAAERALDGNLSRIESQPGFPHSPRSSFKSKSGSMSTPYVQGAVVSIENATGGILAMVGGRDFGESPFNRSFNAKRQAGSSFKPFVYAVAFQRGGLLPGSFVSDDEIRLKGSNGKIWSPKNSDGKFTGLQPAAIGLIRSRNTMSVRVGQIAGIANVRSMARALKFGEIPASPVSFLGAFETTPMTITSAFSTFACKGLNRSPHIIQRIENSVGKVLVPPEIHGTRVFPESVCWLTSDILGRAVNDGTGKVIRAAGYKAPCYGKTGTTNDYRDAWFVGFTDKVTTGVWVGMDRPETIMNHGYGSKLAAPIWTDVMKKAETSGYRAEPLPAPPKMRDVVLCRECGGIANRRTIYPYQMELPPDLMPRHQCPGHGRNLFTNKQRPPRAIPVPEIPGDQGGARGLLGRLMRWIFGEPTE